MGPDTGGVSGKLTPSEIKKIIEEKVRTEKVHLNKPLLGWAIACGLAIGIGVGGDIPALAFAALMAGGTGLIFAEMHETGEKIIRAGKKLGLKVD